MAKDEVKEEVKTKTDWKGSPEKDAAGENVKEVIDKTDDDSDSDDE